MHALAAHVLKYWREFFSDVSDPLNPLLQGLAGQRAKAVAADPIYAAIANHSTANRVFRAACDSHKGRDITAEEDAAANELCNAEGAGLVALSKVKPATRMGALALTSYIFENWSEESGFIGGAERELLDRIISNIVSAKPRNVRPKVDPAYDAIVADWEAWLAYVASCDLPGCGITGHADDAENRRALDSWEAAWQQLGETRPTTLAGMAAIFEYVDATGAFIHDDVADPDRRVAFLSRITPGSARSV